MISPPSRPSNDQQKQQKQSNRSVQQGQEGPLPKQCVSLPGIEQNEERQEKPLPEGRPRHVQPPVARLYAYTAYKTTTGIRLSREICACHTWRVPTTKARKEITYPLSFRVALSQVEEIDAAVVREKRKRRSDLLEAIWEVAWSHYRSSGSLMAYAEGKHAHKYARRVSEELQDQLYTALETILERAPSAVIEEVARKLTQWAGKYGERK